MVFLLSLQTANWHNFCEQGKKFCRNIKIDKLYLCATVWTMKIELKKLNFAMIMRCAHDFYRIVDKNRERLAPYFFWAGKGVTPNLSSTVLFMVAYVCTVSFKRIKYKITNDAYDIPFIIMRDDSVAGMIGLDNISPISHDAEIWFWVSQENEGLCVATQSIKKIEDYSLNQLNLQSLYASVVHTNEKSKAMLNRNNYVVEDIKYNVPISGRNPTITNLIKFRKYITR